MSDDKPVRLHGFEIVDYLAHEQAKRYGAMLDRYGEWLDVQGFNDEMRAALLAEKQQHLLDELRREIKECIAFVMSHGRSARESLH